MQLTSSATRLRRAATHVGALLRQQLLHAVDGVSRRDQLLQRRHVARHDRQHGVRYARQAVPRCQDFGG